MRTANAVIGLGMGDEGKGNVTNFLCSLSREPIVVRFSGGHQVGHTVREKGISHVFSNFGSGTLQGVPTMWSKFCTVEPIGLCNEFDVLKLKGVTPKIYISEKCPVTTPLEFIYNRKQAAKDNHGSCGLGLGATYLREENHYSLTFGDLYSPTILEIKMSLLQKYYGYTTDLTMFYDAVSRITSMQEVISTIGFPTGYKSFIFEGSQGLLLDQKYGFFPHVTRSSVGTTNIPDPETLEIFLVTRAYQTRHGNGPMTNLHIPHSILENPNETNVKNEFQGEFRRSLLDLDLLQYSMSKDDGIRKSKHKTLVITCMDHMVNDYRFTYKKQIIASTSKNEFVRKIANILQLPRVFISESPESKNIYKWEN